jgi:hypothetical protein
MTSMEIVGIKQNLLSYIRSSTLIKFKTRFMEDNLKKKNAELGIN